MSDQCTGNRADIGGNVRRDAKTRRFVHIPVKDKASAGMADRRKEFPRPEQFAPLHRVYIFIIEVKPDDRDMLCTEFIGGKNCTVTVRKSTEIVDMWEREHSAWWQPPGL